MAQAKIDWKEINQLIEAGERHQSPVSISVVELRALRDMGQALGALVAAVGTLPENANGSIQGSELNAAYVRAAELVEA